MDTCQVILWLYTGSETGHGLDLFEYFYIAVDIIISAPADRPISEESQVLAHVFAATVSIIAELPESIAVHQPLH